MRNPSLVSKSCLMLSRGFSIVVKKASYLFIKSRISYRRLSYFLRFLKLNLLTHFVICRLGIEPSANEKLSRSHGQPVLPAPILGNGVAHS